MICSALRGNSKSLPGTEVGATQREIEKSFSNESSDGDSGTSKRVLATLLTWMSEKTAPVFVVATANQVELLPAELIRKGRIDELFFLGLPNQTEREQIFEVHLSRVRPHRVKNKDFDFKFLASRCKDFSGAEIEQVIYEAMQNAFSCDAEFLEDDLMDAIAECVPLAQIAQPQIEALKSWAVRSGAKSASSQYSEIRQSELRMLEVDK
jgi:ATPases of the AAA+ class